MRHYYKSHGRHCYLRSFQSKCTWCNASVLYWESTRGSKVFFEYPPFGKLVRHYCRHRKGLSHMKNRYPVIVKMIWIISYFLRIEFSLKMIKKKIQKDRDQIKTYDKPKFGKINIKKHKKSD